MPQPSRELPLPRHRDALALTRAPSAPPWAAALTHVNGWLAKYHELSLGLNVHSRNKPPGPILLYFALIRIFGDSEQTARICGLTLAGLQAASVIACAALLRVLTRDVRATV